MDYIVNGDYFGTLKGTSFKQCGYIIVVICTIINREKGSVELVAKFIVANSVRCVRVPQDKDLCKHLADKGYMVNSSSERHVRNFIYQQQNEQGALTVYSHSQLGWFKERDELIFKGYISISSQGDKAKIKSFYIGKYDIIPKGRKRDYVNRFNSIISGNIMLEFAAVMGLSGCLNGYLSAIFGQQLDTLLYNLHGGSTTGKSTILKLATAMCGNPNSTTESKESLFGTWSATKNAVISRLEENMGYFIAFDEVGRLTDTSSKELIYSIADGKGKSRCNTQGGRNSVKQWCTSVGSTGEISLLEISNLKDGMMNRLFDLGDIEWTKDGQQALEVEKFSTEYYGIAIHMLAVYLIGKDRKNVIAEYELLTVELQTAIPVDEQFQNRVAKHAAIVVLTAKYMNDMGLNIDVDGIKQFLVANLKPALEVEWQRAYSYFMTQFYKNRDKFINYDPNNYTSQLHRGNSMVETTKNHSVGYTYSKEDEGQYIVILADEFSEWMEKGLYSHLSSILRKWRENGILKSDKDRLVSRRAIVTKGTKQKVYIIKDEGYKYNDSGNEDEKALSLEEALAEDDD